MKNKLKFIILPCLLLAVIIFATSCSQNPSPFDDFDKDGYTVSVKYDANGGLFTTNTATIVDTYNLSAYTSNSNGEKELKLFAPDAAERGNQAYTADKIGFYLAGWYAERVEIKDQDGNVTGYTYGKRWNFDTDKLKVPADGEYSSENAVITLYAAWVPAFTYEFYLLNDSGEPTLIESILKNPLADTEITLPAFDKTSGRVGAPNDFPKLDGMTYGNIYLDDARLNQITASTISHTGRFVSETASLENPVMKIYCTAEAGAQYIITSAEQLTKSSDPSATYTLDADLDFSGKSWPAKFLTGEFSGKIIGNGHTIKNVKATQSNNSHKIFGLFGIVTDKASISDVTFDNIQITIKAFTRQNNASFAILAGEIEDGASISSVTLKNSSLTITSGLALNTAINNYSLKFGLVCADGDADGITFSKDNVTVSFTGSQTEYSYTPDAHGRFTLVEIED